MYLWFVWLKISMRDQSGLPTKEQEVNDLWHIWIFLRSTHLWFVLRYAKSMEEVDLLQPRRRSEVYPCLSLAHILTSNTHPREGARGLVTGARPWCPARGAPPVVPRPWSPARDFLDFALFIVTASSINSDVLKYFNISVLFTRNDLISTVHVKLAELLILFSWIFHSYFILEIYILLKRKIQISIRFIVNMRENVLCTHLPILKQITSIRGWHVWCQND